MLQELVAYAETNDLAFKTPWLLKAAAWTFRRTGGRPRAADSRRASSASDRSRQERRHEQTNARRHLAGFQQRPALAVTRRVRRDPAGDVSRAAAAQSVTFRSCAAALPARSRTITRTT